MKRKDTWIVTRLAIGDLEGIKLFLIRESRSVLI